MIDWHGIRTVLLDMDGTLLDLHYDTYFWLTHLPNRYAEVRGLPHEKARDEIRQAIENLKGSLDWYCLDYWSERLDMDVGALKSEVQDRIGFRAGAQHFLRELRASHCRVVIVTNAHQTGLELKIQRTGLDQWVDDIHTTHSFGRPKEDPAFWPELQAREPFEPQHSLLIDDNHAALRAAESFGIGHLISVRTPDSQQPPVSEADWPAVEHFEELLPIGTPEPLY